MQKLKEKMVYLGFNPKKEFLKLVIVDLALIICGISLFLLSKSLFYMFAILGISVLFTIVYLTRYGNQIDKENALNLEEFCTLFAYFKIYIHNGYNVYSALKEISKFANKSLKKLLDELIHEIDEDKTIEPFIKFAKNFNEIIVEEMMLTIYQMVDDGINSEHLIQYELIFDKFSDLMYQRSLKRKDSRLATISSGCLVASSYLMVVLTIGIISVIGELINGI